MNTNPLLQTLINSIPDGETLTASRVLSFIDSALSETDNYHNFDAATGVVNKTHSVTILYSGNTGGVYNGSIATDMANRLGSEARVLDNTKIGRLLIDITQNGALHNFLDGDQAEFLDSVSKKFTPASLKFNLEATGKVVTILGRDTDPSRVFTQSEIDIIVSKNPNITAINGESIDDIRKAGANLDVDAKKPYYLAHFENSFSKAVVNGDIDLSAQFDDAGRTIKASASWDDASLSKLGINSSIADANTSGIITVTVHLIIHFNEAKQHSNVVLFE